MRWNERSDPDMRTANFCDVYREGVYSYANVGWEGKSAGLLKGRGCESEIPGTMSHGQAHFIWLFQAWRKLYEEPDNNNTKVWIYIFLLINLLHW